MRDRICGVRVNRTEQRARSSAAQYATLGAICLIGFVLRSWNIDREALWGDEALTLIIAHWPIETLFTAPADPTPGLYYVLHKVLIGDAASVAAVRSISLVAGALTIPATYALARACRAPALLAALLVALSFPLIDYSQEARAYALLILLVTSSAAAFVAWTRTNRIRFLFMYATTATLAFYTHLVSVFWIAPSAAALGALGWRTSGRYPIVATLLLMELVSFPEINRLRAYNADTIWWLEAASPKLAFNTVGYAYLPLGLTDGGLHSTSSLIAILVVFTILAWRGSRHWSKLRDWAHGNRGASMALFTLSVAPIGIWLFSFFKPIFIARTILLGVPAWLTGLALLLWLERPAVRLGAVGLFALALAVTGTVRVKDDWRTAATFVARRVKPGDVVIVCASWQAPAFRHAFVGRVAAPLFVVKDGRWIELEPAIGSFDHWPLRYFAAFELDRRRQVSWQEIRTAKRRWLISKSCKETLHT